MTSAGRNAKKPHSCLRSSTRPSEKQGNSSVMKSRINCPFTVSFGRNRHMLLTSLPKGLYAQTLENSVRQFAITFLGLIGSNP